MTNGEKYKTAAERGAAFFDYCDKHLSCEVCPLDEHHEREVGECRFGWLDLDADEEKPLPCPFCGGDVEIKHCVSGIVTSCRCGYFSSFQHSESAAIAAHNRVAKAVKEGEVKKCREVK